MTPKATARSIETWFAKNRRVLPWRTRRTAWRSLVSEFMLQQTQVARVVEKFEPFLERFPNPAALADADEQDVLAMWQGLGYYRRARNLKRAAEAIVEHFGGRTPLDVDALLTLPNWSVHGRCDRVDRRPATSAHRRRQRAAGPRALHADDAEPTSREAVQRAWQRAEALRSKPVRGRPCSTKA